MKRLLLAGAALAAAGLMPGAAAAQETIKIGVILSLSGQFADTGVQMDNGIKLYMKQHGDTVAGKKIEIIRKDTGGIEPAGRQAPGAGTGDARQGRHPGRLCAHAQRARRRRRRDRSQEIHGRHERGDLDRRRPSRLTWCAPRSRCRSSTIRSAPGPTKTAASRRPTRMVSDFGPGIDAEVAFPKGFKEAGGEIVGSVRMPVANPGLLRLRRSAPRTSTRKAIFIFDPGRRQPAALRQGAGRARHRPQEDQGHRPGRDHRRARARSMGDVVDRHHHRLATTTSITSPR